jgi:hypothetical protein
MSVVKPVRVERKGMWYVWERIEMCTVFWWGNLKKGGYLEDLGVDWRIILKWF